ncbi:PREDICTED: bifunctional epoxide hydrolase 2-like isoform X1 [Ipomoea nil]|uniref:bifunctional epoxide hydrolase 2-like isoform X1 n=1 Tax=Ipomoea nil TaxID=35883 RepID=UPI0009011C40|nr:PREDICTED: bifunctional epoxide hydrolase 2-like isoform X1 [Ipomoea nil]XP_019151782.1 PREDICTED: bifunctional epoxide hydrolase 2-like isoform X1 [Ipomoea nil]
MEGIEHISVSVNGISMHVAQTGQGPVVLFLHGFPECWYTWRHQMCFLASQGYRAVAPDLRGYGDTTGAPTDDPSKFTSLHVVGDLVALLSVVAADEEKVFVVGHDWGAMMAWALCLYRPDKVKALVNMSVCFTPRNPKSKPLETLRAVYGDDYYICRFQKNTVNTQINKKLHPIGRRSEGACSASSCCQCRFDIWHWLLCKYKEIKLRFLFSWQEGGEIEGEFAVLGTKKVLQCFLTYYNPSPLYLPKKGKLFEGSTDDLPSWLSKNDVDYYTSKFEKTGFTGGINYYRALDLDWELSAAWTGAKVMVPVKFIVGDLDITYNAPGAKEYIHKGGLKRDVPLLEEVVVLEGVGHFIHEEKPHEINTHILNFLHNFSS